MVKDCKRAITEGRRRNEKKQENKWCTVHSNKKKRRKGKETKFAGKKDGKENCRKKRRKGKGTKFAGKGASAKLQGL